MSVSSNEALQLLQEGNKRFSTGEFATKDLGQARRDELIIKGQDPFAIIITCSDSRVPPELIFDSGLGDLFVIRTAGNVLDPVGMGSAEYAVEHLGTPLLIVLGHDKCTPYRPLWTAEKHRAVWRQLLPKLRPLLKRPGQQGSRVMIFMKNAVWKTLKPL
ncbi:MAG: carbonic anhydrase [Candidatus Syntrophopropionicum ammoniitolerans]